MTMVHIMTENPKSTATTETAAGAGRRQRRRAETARRILDTAMRLFIEQGYANTTI